MASMNHCSLFRCSTSHEHVTLHREQTSRIEIHREQMNQFSVFRSIEKCIQLALSSFRL